MSDLWTSSLFSSPAHSSPTSLGHHGNHPCVTSPHHLPHPQVTSPHPQVTSPHDLPHPQVTSPHYQVTSPHHLPHPQVTSPHPQVTSPHHLPHPQVTSPHPQVTSPHHLPHPQVTSPHHLPHPQVTSPHYQVTSPHPQVTSPHPQVTSPHHLLPPQVNFPQNHVSSPHLLPQTPINSSPHYFPQSQTSPSYPFHQAHVAPSHHLSYSQTTPPHFGPQPQVTSTQVLSSPQQHLSSQNPNPGLENSNWSKSEIPCLFSSYSLSCQNHSTEHLDLQNQEQFSVTEDTHRLSYNTQALVANGVYGQDDTLGPDPWGPLEPTQSQVQCSPLGSMSGGIPLGRWSSAEFRSSSTEEFGTQFYPDSGQQAFCSPTTPGPSPQYPHTPTMSSPGTQVHPRNERQAFHTQPSTQTFSCLPDSDSFPLSSEPGPHLLPGHTEPMLDLTGFFNAVGDLDTSFPPQEGGQNVNSSAQAPSLPAGPAWAAKCGGGSSTGGDVQLDRTWMKRPQPANRAKVLDCRLLCTMCKRDFRSLPALNGHMRSHSGFRSAKCLKKDEDAAAAPPTVSMVMPVSVPIRSRGASRALRMGQRRCTHRSPAVGGAVLYHSLMHLDGDAAVAEGGDEEAAVDGGRGHYTPPPMLCPVRVGTGLYCSLTTWRKHRVQTVHLHNTAHNGLGDHVAMETLTTGTMKPQINVGRGFQAEIPPLRNHKQAHADSQNALQMWTPWYEVEKPVNQPRVDALLMMVRTCVVPGGGASPEHALRVLSECRGDFLLTAEKLLSSPDTSNNNHTGVSWSAAEIRLLVKSLQLHHKDFGSVQRAVQTKSLSQCVEFYYLMKKKLNLGVRTSARLTITLPDTNRPPRCPDTM